MKDLMRKLSDYKRMGKNSRYCLFSPQRLYFGDVTVRSVHLSIGFCAFNSYLFLFLIVVLLSFCKDFETETEFRV